MIKHCKLPLISFVLLLLAVSYPAADEDAKMARYGQYGGPFTLVDQRGESVTDEDFLGRYVLLFFGYTYCPDVCPTTMQAVGETLDILGKTGEKIQPVFITIDPDRDSPQVLAEYVEQFHPRIIGLSGTKQQTLDIANDYGVSYYKLYSTPSFDDTDDSGDGDENDDYLVNHSAATYLMGPDGRFITLFPFGSSPEEMAGAIRGIIKRP